MTFLKKLALERPSPFRRIQVWIQTLPSPIEILPGSIIAHRERLSHRKRLSIDICRLKHLKRIDTRIDSSILF